MKKILRKYKKLQIKINKAAQKILYSLQNGTINNSIAGKWKKVTDIEKILILKISKSKKTEYKCIPFYFDIFIKINF